MALALSPDSTAASLLGGYRELSETFSGSRDTHYSIAGHNVRLSFANSWLAPFVSREISHLAAEPSDNPDLTIYCWQSGDTGIKPCLPWLEKDLSLLADPGILGPRLHYSDHKYRLTSTARDNLAVYSRKTRRALYWVDQTRDNFDRAQAATLRELLNWHLAEHGRFLAHTAAVGNARGMVLLTGASGSGKSTSALACVGSPLRFCGDDNCFVSMEPEPTVYSLYGSAKISPEAVKYVPDRLSRAVEYAPTVYDKGVVFVSEVMPESLIRQGPIKAILACRVTDKPTSKLSPASSAQALRALAPTSMIAFSGNGAQAMAQMLRLVQQCPTWSLDLGRDTHRLPDLISGLLNAT